MTLDKGHKTIAVELMIEKSERNMEQAIHNANSDYWDLVSNRLYYSIFHAVNACWDFVGIFSKNFGIRENKTTFVRLN